MNFVYKSGRTIHGPLLAIKYAANPHGQTYRVAIVVSRKVNKSAVARNRMRRRLYAIMREMGNQINGPYDIVITVFHDTLISEPQKKLVTQVKNQLSQAGILSRSD